MRRLAERLLTAAFVVVIVSLVLGQVFGQPILLAYVESGSMEPTIDAGDGFIAVPPPVAGAPSVGDVVTFKAEAIEGGGLTTHRIVDKTSEGYITRGDANPFTDQDSDEPPVTEEQIVAHALQIGDTVVTIPALGTLAETVRSSLASAVGIVTGTLGLSGSVTGQSVGLALFALGLVLLVVSLIDEYRGGGPQRQRTRSRSPDHILNVRLVAIGMVLLVLVPANAAMVLPSETTEITVDGDQIDAAEVEPGEPVEASFDLRNSGMVAMLVAFEPADERVQMDYDHLSVPPGQSASATASIPAPPPDERTTVAVDQYRYLVLGPEPVLLWLHERGPWIAWLTINGLITASILGLLGGFFGFGRVRLRDRSRDLPLLTRLRRKL